MRLLASITILSPPQTRFSTAAKRYCDGWRPSRRRPTPDQSILSWSKRSTFAGSRARSGRTPADFEPRWSSIAREPPWRSTRSSRQWSARVRTGIGDAGAKGPPTTWSSSSSSLRRPTPWQSASTRSTHSSTGTRGQLALRNYVLMLDGLRPLVDLSDLDRYENAWWSAAVTDHTELDEIVLAELAAQQP